MGPLILPVWGLTGGLGVRYERSCHGPDVSRENSSDAESEADGRLYFRHLYDLSASLVEPPQGIEITYPSLLLAVLSGVIHAGLAPVLQVSGVRPNILLVVVVLVTAFRGLGAGISWAFAGGLVANLLTTAPLGSVPLAMLAVAIVVGGTEQLIGRLWFAVPIVAALVGSVIADVIELGALRLLDQAPSVGFPLGLVAGAAALNAAVVALFLYPARQVVRRVEGEPERAW